MENIETILISVGLTTSIVLLILYLRGRKANTDLSSELEVITKQCEGYEIKFRSVLDVETETTRVRTTAEQDIARLRSDADKLREQYATALRRFQDLEKEVNALEENLENISVGLYRPHFTYTDSEDYKEAIDKIRDSQVSMIREGRAAICGTAWTVSGSVSEGKRMIKQYQKLILRAFNADSDAAIANVSWNNFNVMRARIEKAFEVLNKSGTVMHVALSEDYLGARLTELKLVFEAAEKKRQEKEEQRRLRAEQREEERVQRELSREKEDAEKDELKYQKAIDKVKKEMEKALDAEREAMSERIKELEVDLAAAHDRRERAIAQAQLTKVGHVYIISNIGALGEGVLKIGLTRRLEPEERVQELGDASVPFPFDIHALIYSENAPELEAKLHERFWDRRVNWSNDRKEFFRVSLDEIKLGLTEFGLSSKLLTVPEAREYRETLVAIEEAKRVHETEALTKSTVRFPSDPFSENGSDGSQLVGT